MTTKEESYELEPFTPPEWKLIQATTKLSLQREAVGKFYHLSTGEISPNLRAVIVAIPLIRTYWGRETIEISPPMCQSANAYSYRSINGDNCRECPYSAFTDTPWLIESKDRRNYCLPHYCLIGFTLEGETALDPFLLRAPGNSSSPIRSLASTIALRKKQRSFGRNKPIFPIVILQANTHESKLGTSFAIAIKIDSWFSPEQEKEYEFELEHYPKMPLIPSLSTDYEEALPSNREPAALPAPPDQASIDKVKEEILSGELNDLFNFD